MPGPTLETKKAVKDVDGGKESRLTNDEKKFLTERLEEKFPKVDKSSIQKQVEIFDNSSSRALFLYTHNTTDQLWSFTSVGGNLVVFMNTNHSFYTSYIMGLNIENKEQMQAKSAIELFIISLAYEEDQLKVNENKKKNVEIFRSKVGVHLKEYLYNLEVSDEEF